MKKKTLTKFHNNSLKVLEVVSEVIAYGVCVGLLIASALIVLNSFGALGSKDLDVAVQDGLFVLILLEMFYVTRSFIRHGSINVSIIVSVGVIAAVKEMIFQLNNMTLELALGFGVIFITLSVTYFLERRFYKSVIKEKDY
jgi:uncharacterized membrane protein (DUF373 family)